MYSVVPKTHIVTGSPLQSRTLYKHELSGGSHRQAYNLGTFTPRRKYNLNANYPDQSCTDRQRYLSLQSAHQHSNTDNLSQRTDKFAAGHWQLARSAQLLQTQFATVRSVVRVCARSTVWASYNSSHNRWRNSLPLLRGNWLCRTSQIDTMHMGDPGQPRSWSLDALWSH